MTTRLLYTDPMAHIHEKIDFTASVYIVHEGKVLLHMHKKLGKWLQPGGHIELDEDPNEAAIRETKEETGYAIELIGHPRVTLLETDPSESDIIPPKFLNRHHFNEVHEHVDFIYFGRIIGGTEAAEEGSEIRWFSREDILSDASLYATTRAYALAALAELA